MVREEDEKYYFGVWKRWLFRRLCVCIPFLLILYKHTLSSSNEQTIVIYYFKKIILYLTFLYLWDTPAASFALIASVHSFIPFGKFPKSWRKKPSPLSLLMFFMPLNREWCSFNVELYRLVSFKSSIALSYYCGKIALLVFSSWCSFIE